MSPMDAIFAERKRQIEVEGWTSEHDDTHDGGEMLHAAVFYYQNAARPDVPLNFDADGTPIGWPWDAHWWKPKDRHRDLVRAGALCLAEIERLQRAGRTNIQHVNHKLDLIVKAMRPGDMSTSD